jgi:hypothetical protein
VALCGLLLVPVSLAAETTMPAPAVMSVSQLAAKALGGNGWLLVEHGEKGRKTTQSVILKADMTFENFISAEGGDMPPISAYGGGVWFARIAADGAIEIALGRNAEDTNPEWVVRLLADGNLQDGAKIWARGK